ncbi:hypothetical protein ATL39_3421 [Sinobaca qinghaiensis]|uniref:Uncharacterized protein n=1 Tax=Sinobaca qinghaiensis TaxID=342944 RepID=A0A419UUA0_9BACL|nr:hypothetical protein [Sinobaca qinghaiensis]RKD68147.1 hypothetical protein ATL39_3421 [Sinobaca qinghaiensis]
MNKQKIHMFHVKQWVNNETGYMMHKWMIQFGMLLAIVFGGSFLFQLLRGDGPQEAFAVLGITGILLLLIAGWMKKRESTNE